MFGNLSENEIEEHKEKAIKALYEVMYDEIMKEDWDFKSKKEIKTTCDKFRAFNKAIVFLKRKD